MSVLGPISSLPAWAKKYGVRQVIVALPSAAHGVRRRVAEICADAGIEVLTVPSYEDLISGRSALTTIRTIELDDLLGRDPVVLDNAGLGEWLGNRVVMVTGAGGSIGAELCRHIARFRPAKLVLFDLSEAAVYAIQTALADGFRSCRWRRSSATSSTRRWSSRCWPASGRASSSTPAPTSTCR